MEVIAEHAPAALKRWSFDTLFKDLVAIIMTASSLESGYADHWNIRVVRLVGVWRSEKYKANYIDDWDRRQRSKAAANSQNGRMW